MSRQRQVSTERAGITQDIQPLLTNAAATSKGSHVLAVGHPLPSDFAIFCVSC